MDQQAPGDHTSPNVEPHVPLPLRRKQLITVRKYVRTGTVYETAKVSRFISGARLPYPYRYRTTGTVLYGWVQEKNQIVAHVALVWDVSYAHLGPASELIFARLLHSSLPYQL